MVARADLEDVEHLRLQLAFQPVRRKSAQRDGEAISLMDILEERYQKAPLIVTSQVEPQGWLKLFEDQVIAEAIVDRLIHPCQKITLKGEHSYREKIKEKRGLKNNGGLM